jgi:hypothetical protein
MKGSDDASSSPDNGWRSLLGLAVAEQRLGQVFVDCPSGDEEDDELWQRDHIWDVTF